MTPDPIAKLLPCPFCGSPAGEIIHAFAPQLHEDGSIYQARRVTCSNRQCVVAWSSKPNEAEAIAAWNTRALPAPPAPEVGWIACSERMPEFEKVVECAEISGFDGSAYRMFGCLTDHGEDGFLWAKATHGFDPDDCEADDDYRVFAWREPTPLPAPPPIEKDKK